MGPVPYRLGVDRDAHAAVLVRKLEVIRKLCAALEAFLAIDVERELELVKGMPERQKPTLDDLDRAQSSVDAFTQQIDAIQTYANSMPEEARAMVEAQITPLKMMLKDAERYRDQVQKAIEESEVEEPKQ